MCETDFYQIPKDINEIIYPQVNDTDGQYDLRMPSVAQADYSIRDVWQSNLEQEFRTIRQIVQTYKYVAMDTEFPGVVARPIGEFRSNADYHYQQLRCNVDLLKIIQVGMTFLNDYGQTPTPISTWQFNFKFNLTVDMYAQESIDLLVDSGIQFKKHEEEGINTDDFAELLMTSGVVLTDQVKWLSFHSGYDFGYMLKILTNTNLPADEADFFELLRIYFPNIYDVKYLMKSCKNLKGGLQEVAQQLEIPRVGPQHQAGSDSLLTGAAFFNMREMFFEDNIDDAKYCGHLYGLGNSYVVNGSGNGASSNNGNNGGSNINTNNGNNNSSSNNNGSSFENHNSGASSASNGDSSNTQNSSS
ncbi:CCR4-NOT transcription complex subunit 7-like [Argonauta hians]